MNGMKINAALIFAMALQACALVWFLSQQNSKIEEIYKFYQQESEKSVVENQVKMELDLENIIADVGELKKVIKKLRNKDADIQKVNKKIILQHDKLFDLIAGNSSTNRSYSYGD